MALHLLVGLLTLLVLVSIRLQLVRAVTEPTPGGAVILTSVMYLVGATIVVWRDGSAAANLVYFVCVALISVYCFAYLGTCAAFGLSQYSQRPVANWLAPGISPLMKFAFLAFAVGSVGAVVYLTGTNKLLAALYQFVVAGDSETSVLELRVGFSSGEERWFAPGYVKQLRDVLMPLAALLVLFTLRLKPLRFLVVAALLIPIVAVLMISSGERGPVLLFLIGAAYSARQSLRNGTYSLRVLLVPLVCVAAVGGGAFVALTSSFTSRQYDDMPMALILADRIVTRAPEENVNGAPVWSQGASFPGAGWLSELASVLPGTQVTLSNLIHEELGGSDKGNSVLGMWVDVFYNFGYFFSVPVAATLGVLIAFFNHWVNTRRKTSHEADVCGIWISVTMLMVLSPLGFLLYGPFLLSGVLAVMLLYQGRGSRRLVASR